MALCVSHPLYGLVPLTADLRFDLTDHGHLIAQKSLYGSPIDFFVRHAMTLDEVSRDA